MENEKINVAVEVDGPERFVLWAHVSPYKFGWVKDFGPMQLDLTLDPREAKRIGDLEAGHLGYECTRNGISCFPFCAARVERKEVS